MSLEKRTDVLIKKTNNLLYKIERLILLALLGKADSENLDLINILMGYRADVLADKDTLRWCLNELHQQRMIPLEEFRISGIAKGAEARKANKAKAIRDIKMAILDRRLGRKTY